MHQSVSGQLLPQSESEKQIRLGGLENGYQEAILFLLFPQPSQRHVSIIARIWLHIMDHHEPEMHIAFEGVMPHSCQFCSRILVGPDRCVAECHSGRSKHYPHIFSLEDVCQAAHGGCPFFSKELDRAFKNFERSCVMPHSLEILPHFWDDGEALFDFTWFDSSGRCIEFAEVEEGEVTAEVKSRWIFALAGMSFYP